MAAAGSTGRPATSRRADPAAAAREPGRALGKIDWIFTRGLRASRPAIVPALRRTARQARITTAWW